MYKLVVDLEATCTNQDEFPREEMETIEIGAVMLKDNKIVDQFQCFIKPEINPILTDFCTELTTIKQSDVESAKDFKTCMTDFLNWIAKASNNNNYLFYSWGAFDKNILLRQCIQHKVDGRTLINSHRNAKEIFGKDNNLKRAPGVSKALSLKNMKFEGTQHRALDDAINISKLVITLNS